jgi:hypothetical protein
MAAPTLGAITGREQVQQTARLFDLLVGDQQQAQGHVNVECARRRQIDAQDEFGRKLDRQVANRRAPQDAIDVIGSNLSQWPRYT